MKLKPKQEATAGGTPPEPSCPFCGRRKAIRRLEGRMFYCGHCEKAFQVQ